MSTQAMWARVAAKNSLFRRSLAIGRYVISSGAFVRRLDACLGMTLDGRLEHVNGADEADAASRERILVRDAQFPRLPARPARTAYLDGGGADRGHHGGGDRCRLVVQLDGAAGRRLAHGDPCRRDGAVGPRLPLRAAPR